MHTISSRLGRAKALLLVAGALAAAPAMAIEYWLQTGATTLAGVPMWGYALCGTGATPPAGCSGAVSVPGPALVVPPGEGLIVHLTNTLPAPTSLVIAGQLKQEGMQPVWFDPAGAAIFQGARPAGNTSARVRSFDKEAAAGGGVATYTWASIKPGTYLYSSGTHPQVQVQMGLYGAMSKDAGVGQVAYTQGATNVAYSSQATLLYSEVDPALHAAVAAGTYGASGPHSTLEYHPTFFLINGKAWPDAGLDPVVTVPAGQSLLLRLLNAGLKTHVPTLHRQYWRLIAEDGNPLPYLSNPRQQYSAFLPAGKTVDVLLRPDNPSTADTLRYAIFDSRHFDTSNGAAGGMLARFAVAPAAAEAPQFDSAPPAGAIAGAPYQYAAHAVASAGHAVQYTLVTAPAGMAVNGSSGLVTWTAGAAGSYPVTLRATDTVVPALFRDQSFAVVVTAAPNNHAPQATPDSYTGVIHVSARGAQVVPPRGVLANDTDADNDALTAVCAGGACQAGGRVTLGADGGFTLSSATTTGNVVFSYHAQDSAASSANVNVTVTMVANRAPVGAADDVSAPRCTFRLGTACRTGAGYYQPLSFNLASNDSDPDSVTIDAANQLPLAVARVRPGTSGSGSIGSIGTQSGGLATVTGGMVSYVPPYDFAGTDRFYYRVKDKLGKESGSTTTNTNNLGAGWIAVTVTVK